MLKPRPDNVCERVCVSVCVCMCVCVNWVIHVFFMKGTLVLFPRPVLLLQNGYQLRNMTVGSCLSEDVRMRHTHTHTHTQRERERHTHSAPHSAVHAYDESHAIN